MNASPAVDLLRGSAMLRALKQKSPKTYEWLKWQFTKKSYESVYCVIMHRSASSVFGHVVLRNVEGMTHMYWGIRRSDGTLIHPRRMKKYGYVYGPIRPPFTPKGPYARLADERFVRGKIFVIMVRDPRDMLVSQYYSFGFSHGMSKDPEKRARHESAKKKIQSQTVDEYVLANADGLLLRFHQVIDLETICSRTTTLRYEDMIENFREFHESLTKIIKIKPRVAREIYLRTRPRSEEDIYSHKRSGKVAGFRDKLEAATIDALNLQFAEILKRYQYKM